MSISQIYEGWRNNLFPPKHLKTLIKTVTAERLSICKNCEHHSKHHKSLRPDDHCIQCGCTLSAKTACLSCSCPVYKWREVMTSEQEEEMEEVKESFNEQAGDKEDSP